MYKVGIIGFGKMGMLHGALLEGTRNAKVVAICDKSIVMRLGFKKVHKGVRTYNDINKMLEKENLDIVVVSTPTFNHKTSVINCIKKGCHVFVEKPLAITSEECRDILREKQKSENICVQIGFCNRFAPSISLAKKKLEQKCIGDIVNVHGKMFIADVFEEHIGWRYNKDLSGGGVLMDFGIHMIDLLIWIFGPIKNINAETKKLYSKDVDDEAKADFIFENGINATFETSWSKKEYRKSYTNIQVIGTQGSMTITDQTLDIYDKEGDKVEALAYPQMYDGSFIDIGGLLFSHQISAFLNYIENGDKTGGTVEDSVYVQNIVEEIYRSANEHKEISMEAACNGN